MNLTPAGYEEFLSEQNSSLFCFVLFCCCSFNLKIKPYNKSFIDQACSAKMAGYWPRSFFCVFMDRDEVEVHKNAKKELYLGQYPAILTEQAWSITHMYSKLYAVYHLNPFRNEEEE